nr:EAL domain-containing protein [uncultured Rhodopila sp.]
MLLLVLGSYLITVGALLAGSAYLTHDRMINDRIAKLQAVVDVAETQAKLLQAEVAAGRLTRGEATDRFRSFIYATRYNGDEYLFVYDLDGNTIALGNDPALQGENRMALRDVTGRLLVQSIIATARGNGGTLKYWYPRAPGEAPVPKLAYVREYRPWDLLIGTGVYVGDIDSAFRRYLFDVAMVVLGALAVAGGLATWIGRDVAATVTQQRAAEAKIIHLAHHDMLTGLPNRASFQDTLAAAVAEANRSPAEGAALLLCDLDRFKEVNDTYGHPAGDELLRQVAARMLDTIRRDDMLARLGGDEFAFAMVPCRHPRQAESLASRVIDALSRPFEVHGHMVSIGVSIGIAMAPADASDPVELMKQADTALYVSKRRDRGIASVYHPAMSLGMQERLELEADLRRASDSGEFTVHYQPIVELQARRVVGFEALLRWQHPVRGLLWPDAFIKTAEECGLLVEIGRTILRRACRDAAGWERNIRVAVNIASQQLQAPHFVADVEAALDSAGLAADRLELEITERVMLTDTETALSALARLRGLGVHVSLDDFGTGYSSLSYLQKFPVDRIKVDRSFVRNLGAATEAEAIIRAVVSLGTVLGIRTLAEGIETEDQARRATAATCDEGQGYLFSRPVPAEEVAGLIEKLDHAQRMAMAGTVA